ncbi:MAG: hypothetical protein US34_C0013G0021 [Candidatus Nomurabacteria bacterium GW2011_GWC2_36_9]|nr:MAG: hypothetical protein US34_C0013G0021 [Candidatus Nomurabacteria bacterium GW2011_GWC2_36_9]
MIHILVGDDTKSKNDYIKGLTRERESSFLNGADLDKGLILSYGTNTSLFGGLKALIMENALKEDTIVLDATEWNLLKESETLFIFKEDKLLAVDQKKYKKYGEIKTFESKKKAEKEKFNVFQITDAYANRDKVTAWTLYRKGIEAGVEPEAIAGILFWKIKTMILSSARSFDKDELKHNSSSIVSIYHKAHRGEVDLTIGLEQFILNSLSSK